MRALAIMIVAMSACGGGDSSNDGAVPNNECPPGGFNIHCTIGDHCQQPDGLECECGFSQFPDANGGASFWTCGVPECFTGTQSTCTPPASKPPGPECGCGMECFFYCGPTGHWVVYGGVGCWVTDPAECAIPGSSTCDGCPRPDLAQPRIVDGGND